MRPDERQLLLDAPQTGIRPWRPETWSEEHRAWVRRKLREREGLELRACDRAQVTAQLEDLGAL